MRWRLLIGCGALCAVIVLFVLPNPDRPSPPPPVSAGPLEEPADEPAFAALTTTTTLVQVPMTDPSSEPTTLRGEAVTLETQPSEPLPTTWTRTLSQRVESAAAAGFTSNLVPASTYMENFDCNGVDTCGFVARVAEPDQVFKVTSSLMKSVNANLAKTPESRNLMVLLEQANPGQRMASFVISPRAPNVPCPNVQLTENESGQLESVSVEFKEDDCRH